MMPLPLIYAPEVVSARATGRAIVALESTIITHGMPFPQNVETARLVEAEIRNHGAVPATIAVMAGSIHIGLTDTQLETLGQARDVMKLSRADLAAGLALGRTGATTVAATMICAHLAGISVFATGGIGGVHRGAEASFDISADLAELGHTPVTVVAAGAKAILDLPKTLEVLETFGVPVIAFGQDGFPAFWSRESGLKSPLRMDSAAQIATSHLMRAALGIPGDALPFVGHDRWHAYELSWLDPRGKPQVATATLLVPAESPNLVESKSLKLYLNSCNNARISCLESLYRPGCASTATPPAPLIQ